MEPEHTQATLTLFIDGQPVDIGEWLRGIIREQVTEAFNRLAETISGNRPSITVKGDVGQFDRSRMTANG